MRLPGTSVSTARVTGLIYRKRLGTKRIFSLQHHPGDISEKFPRPRGACRLEALRDSGQAGATERNRPVRRLPLPTDARRRTAFL